MLLLKGVVTNKVQQASSGVTYLIISGTADQNHCLYSLNLVQQQV